MRVGVAVCKLVHKSCHINKISFENCLLHTGWRWTSRGFVPSSTARAAKRCRWWWCWSRRIRSCIQSITATDWRIRRIAAKTRKRYLIKASPAPAARVRLLSHSRSLFRAEAVIRHKPHQSVFRFSFLLFFKAIFLLSPSFNRSLYRQCFTQRNPFHLISVSRSSSFLFSLDAQQQQQ